MGRQKDWDNWNLVEKVKDGKLQCRRCKHKFKGGVSRIKAHVGGIQGKGIKLCAHASSFPDNEGVDYNVVAGSSNPKEVVNSMNSLQGLAEMEEHVHVIGSGNCAFESERSEITKLVDDLTTEEDDIKGQLQWLESHGKKRKRFVDDWLEEAAYLKERACEAIDLENVTREFKYHTAEKPLVLWNELVGESFEENYKSVLKLLQDDEVFIIGVHGMGGVGKTCLVTHVKDEIKREGGTLNFKHVFWVTVSQKFSIFKLQNDIAKRVGLKLDEDDEIIRAEMLSSALEERKKCVLILDDVWNYIDLYKVGIPLRVNGVKLILTSRLKHVYQQMGCPPNNIISMEPLFDDEEAWELFSLKLGYNGTPATLPPDVEEIAKAVAKKCEGLPLGISVIARNMKEVNDIGQWRHALNKFQNLATGEEMEKELFKVLKFSYDNLIDINMQKCFLNCALYGQIEYTREFIIKMVDKGLINGMRSLEEIFDEGLAILVKLESHSLLLHKGDGNLCMHDLVRNMACHIMGHGYMVKCNRGLTRIPRIHEWTADLELVSLANNKIEEIPVGTSPQCPKLSTLIFSHNLYSCIPDCFFHHMNALTELDISDNASLTCLPNSLSNLRSLVCLVLRGCESLKYVPSLGELQKLSRLDISHTSIEKVPRGLEMLINLKWLNLSGNKRLTLETWSVVQSLTSMQYLDLLSENVKVEVEDVQGMSMLECFRCNFRDCKNLNDYVKTTLAPNTYDLRLGNSCSFDFESELEDRTVSFGDCEEFEHLLPRDVTKLRIGGNQQWTGCLCDALSFNGPSSLREIRIEDCTKLESLFCLSVSCSFCTHLQHLEYLRLQCLGSLDVIWKENDDGVTAMSPPPGGIDMFSHLKHLEIWRCDKMEKLMTSAWLPQLPNLESIKVHSCESMKEIFACEVDTITVTLPNLTNLTLKYLRQLKTVCSGIIATKSSPRVYAICCPDLKCSLKYKSSDSISDSVTPLEFRVSPL